MTSAAIWKGGLLCNGLRDTDDGGVFLDQWEDKDKKKKREGYVFS